MTLEGKNYLGIVDFIVVGATIGFSLAIGAYYACCGKAKQSSEELLVGSRKLGALPVAASMLVSYLSAITILGYPAEVYSYGIQIFLMPLSGIVTYPLSVYFFVIVLYKLKLTSSYSYLEMRFNSVAVRMLGSFTFILQILLINGIVLYAPAIAMEAMIGFPVWVSVVVIAICGTIYTSIGGIKAVIWTDVFQFVMILIGMSALVTKGIINAGGIYETFRIAEERGRLKLIDLTVDPFMRHNTLNILIGNGFVAMCLVGTHQPLVQRYCSLPSLKDAIKALTFTYLMGILTVGLVILTGIVIFATYADCDPVTEGKIKTADQIVPYFVIEHLAFIPGLMGLFVAVILSAVLSTISSSLNSLAAVTWEDFLCKISWFKNMEDKAQAVTYKIISVIFGLMFVGLAFIAQSAGSLFQATLTVVGATSGVLGSIFVMGVFLPFINKTGAVIGMVSGLVVMAGITVKGLLLLGTYNFNEKLPISVSNCSMEVQIKNSTYKDLEYPDKLFTISYLLYPLIGAFVTIVVGSIVSIITNCSSNEKRPRISNKYLHPILHRKKGQEKTMTMSTKEMKSTGTGTDDINMNTYM